MRRPLLPTRPRSLRWQLVLLILSVATLLAAACGDDSDGTDAAAGTTTIAGTGTTAGSGTTEPLKVAYIPCGKINDKSWSQAGYDALVEAKAELGLDLSVSESLSPAEVEDAMRDYARRGFKVVLGHCGSFVDAATKVAAEFPDTWFEAAGAPEAPGPNTFSYDPRQEEGSFLAGVLAGSLTKSDVVGMIVAYDFPAFNRQSEAFALGARFIDPAVRARTTYIDTFEDAAKAKEAAIGQIDQGADLLYVATDQAAVGVFEASKERGTLAIAQYADQQALAPDTIVTSVLYRQGKTLIEILSAIQKGELAPSSAFKPGLAEGVGDLAPLGTFESRVPAPVKDCLAKLSAQIAAGTFDVPGVDQIGSQGSAETIDLASLGSEPACEGLAS